jgi:integrase
VIQVERDGVTTFALRFTAYGRRRYVTLGTSQEGWTPSDAERTLRHTLSDVERGIWQPPKQPQPASEESAPTDFRTFSSAWLESRHELSEAAKKDYQWQLTHHLLPFFADHELSEITIAEVDRYREHKVRQGRLNATSINKTITRLGQILEVAQERDLIARNPVRVNPRRRKVKTSAPRRRYLDRAEQIAALLAAAGELDAKGRGIKTGRRALIATLVMGGLRISEALELRWRDIDMAGRRIRLQRAKTAAGVRDVPIMPQLAAELQAHRGALGATNPNALVFSTRSGRPLSRDNTRQRVLGKAVNRANEILHAAEYAPLPDSITQHSLRHTYISLRLALGDDPAAVAQDAGHADMSVTFRVYTHVMRLGEGERQALRDLVDGTAMPSLDPVEKDSDDEEPA